MLYLLAMVTTRRRLASISSRLAASASCSPRRMICKVRRSSSAEAPGFFLDVGDLALQVAHLPPQVLALVFLGGHFLTLQRAQAIHHLADALNQPLGLQGGEPDAADLAGDFDQHPGQRKAVATEIARFLGLGDHLQLLLAAAGSSGTAC